jgi:hypothetical protein
MAEVLVGEQIGQRSTNKFNFFVRPITLSQA